MCKLLLTLIVKSVNSVDGGTLVVTTQQKKVFWVFDLKKKNSLKFDLHFQCYNLVCQEKANSLQRLLPSVHIISCNIQCLLDC